MKTEITKTRYNLTALIGWAAIVIGLVSAGVQLYKGSASSIILLAIGMIGGGITVMFAGPLKTTTTQLVDLRPANARGKQEDG